MVNRRTVGSLGAVIALLLSFYLVGIAVLLGGVLNGIFDRKEADRAKAAGAGLVAEGRSIPRTDERP